MLLIPLAGFLVCLPGEGLTGGVIQHNSLRSRNQVDRICFTAALRHGILIWGWYMSEMAYFGMESLHIAKTA